MILEEMLGFSTYFYQLCKIASSQMISFLGHHAFSILSLLCWVAVEHHQNPLVSAGAHSYILNELYCEEFQIILEFRVLLDQTMSWDERKYWIMDIKSTAGQRYLLQFSTFEYVHRHFFYRSSIPWFNVCCLAKRMLLNTFKKKDEISDTRVNNILIF